MHLWDKYLVHKPRAKIFWIGHIKGCQDIKYLWIIKPIIISTNKYPNQHRYYYYILLMLIIDLLHVYQCVL